MGIVFLPDAHSMVVIELPDRQPAPDGAMWVNLQPSGEGWWLDGNLPEPRRLMQVWGEYRRRHEAVDAAIAYAHLVEVAVLYVETDARRG